MKRSVYVLVMAVCFCGLSSAWATDFVFHGDLNHRVMYTNHFDWFQGDHKGVLNDGNMEDNYAEIKYRLWTEVGMNDGKILGVFAIEMGGIPFGDAAKGGSYSGDKINMETRWAYTDYQIPGISNKSRVRVGLQPFKVNSFLWNETAMAVKYYESYNILDLELAWLRTCNVFEVDDSDTNVEDIDYVYARYDLRMLSNFKTGIFGVYGFNTGNPGETDSQYKDKDGNKTKIGKITPRSYMIKRLPSNVKLRLWHAGLDGSFSANLPYLPFVGDVKLTVNWDGIYQFGKIKNAMYFDDIITEKSYDGDLDVNAYLVALQFGLDMDKIKFSYTGWYASGDRDPEDDQLNGFMAIDMHRSESIILFEGSFADEKTFTGRPNFLDKGFIMNKVALDYKVTDTIKVGLAGLHMRTSEPINYLVPLGYRDQIIWNGQQPTVKKVPISVLDSRNRSIGYEVDAYMTVSLYQHLEFGINGGYLFSGRVMDLFEVKRDGFANEDVYSIASRIRYKF